MHAMPSASIDSVICDPPYGLGFMGKGWDHGVPGVEFWLHALKVAKPGSYLLAFGGTRTHHRLTCAIEDAGWEIRDCLMWLYGQGYPKHGSSLKPGWEPIVMARAPSSTATLLNIDACRLGSDEEYEANCSGDRGHTSAREAQSTSFVMCGGKAAIGRWPANVVLDEEAAAQLDEQTGSKKSGANPTRRGSPKTRAVYGEFAGQEACVPARGADEGGASRFFYCAKANRTERDVGMEGFAERPLFWSQGTKNPGTFQSDGTKKHARNNHPTVKPIALMRWLARLVTPVSGVVLDPFCGSGSTGCAAIAEGFGFVGCEIDPDYASIARARIAKYSEAA